MTREEKFEEFMKTALDSAGRIAKCRSRIFKNVKDAGIKYPSEDIIFKASSENAIQMAAAGTLDEYDSDTAKVREEIRSFYEKISKKPE